MAEYKTMTLYIGTAELAESFKEKATATVFGTPSAMVQAIAKGEAVVVRKDKIEQIRANFLPIYSYILGMDADMSLIEMLENVADDLRDLIGDGGENNVINI